MMIKIRKSFPYILLYFSLLAYAGEFWLYSILLLVFCILSYTWTHKGIHIKPSEIYPLIIPPYIIGGIIIGWSQMIIEILSKNELCKFNLRKATFLIIINFLIVYLIVRTDGNRYGGLRKVEALSRSMWLFFKVCIFSIIIGILFTKAFVVEENSPIQTYAIDKGHMHEIYKENLYRKDRAESRLLYFIRENNREKPFPGVTLKQIHVPGIQRSVIPGLFFHRIIETQILTMENIFRKKHVLDFSKDKIDFIEDKNIVKVTLKHPLTKDVHLIKEERYKTKNFLKSKWSFWILIFFPDFILLYLPMIVIGALMSLFLGVAIQFIGSFISRKP